MKKILFKWQLGKEYKIFNSKKELIKEKQDAYLFDLSYDYVGDLAETVSLLWDQKKEGNMPGLSFLFESLTKAKNEDLKSNVIDILDISNADQRLAFIKLFTGGQFCCHLFASY